MFKCEAECFKRRKGDLISDSNVTEVKNLRVIKMISSQHFIMQSISLVIDQFAHVAVQIYAQCLAYDVKVIVVKT